MLQFYIANFLKGLKIHFKWWSSSFRLYQIFAILIIQMLFSQIKQAPGPDFRKVGKSLLMIIQHTLAQSGSLAIMGV